MIACQGQQQLSSVHAGRVKPLSVKFTPEEAIRIQISQDRIRNQVQVTFCASTKGLSES